MDGTDRGITKNMPIRHLLGFKEKKRAQGSSCLEFGIWNLYPGPLEKKQDS